MLADLPLAKPAGSLFATAFAVLILFLILGFTPFRAVSLSLLAVLSQAALHPDTRIGIGDLVAIAQRVASAGVSLIAATLSRGVLLVGSNHDYIRQSDGLPNRVSCDVATGACDRRAFAAGWRRAVESKCARRGGAQPVDRGAAVGWDGLCS